MLGFEARCAPGSHCSRLQHPHSNTVNGLINAGSSRVYTGQRGFLSSRASQGPLSDKLLLMPAVLLIIFF
jgi:hypothetical protein